MTIPSEFESALYARPLGDEYWIIVYPMTFGKARLCYATLTSIEDAYCYADPRRAIEAARVWTGEGDPLDGWHRHPSTGRRRDNGDPQTEYVYW